jgi:RNA polymerase sigma factor (sigma-70 family)
MDGGTVPFPVGVAVTRGDVVGALSDDGAPGLVAVVTADPLRDLFDAHYGAMVRLAGLLMGGTATAEDVVQDAFVAVDRRLADVDPSAHYAYLRRAVINRARSTHRWNHALKRRTVVDHAVATDPEDVVLTNDRRRRVAEALALLPDRQRHCVVLRYYAGMTDQEIADHFDLAVGSVKNHIHRGRQALKATLGDLR